jgi:4-amino-4-deoxy-L-arabinose transferase-like glycosyltransferase
VLGVLGTTGLALVGLRLLLRRWPAPEREARLPPEAPVVHRRRLDPLRLFAKLLVVIAVILAIVGPWWHAVEQRYPGILWQTIYEEVFVRARKPQEGHTGPPGYYLLAVWATFFPWSLLLPAALVEAWRLRGERSVQFALAAVIGPWIMFELVATKLPHYILPTYAPLAYLVARVLIRSADGDTTEFHQPHWPNVVAVWAVIVALLGFAPWLAAYFFHPLPWQTYVALAILAAWTIFYAVKVHAEFDRRYPAAAAMWMGLGMIGNVYVLYTGVFPVSQFMRLGERVANVVPHDVPVGQAIMIDYKEDSVAFYQGGTIRKQEHDDFLTRTDPSDWPDWVVMSRRVWDATPPERQALLHVVERTSGWNYAGGGKYTEVVIARRRDALPAGAGAATRPSTAPAP